MARKRSGRGSGGNWREVGSRNSAKGAAENWEEVRARRPGSLEAASSGRMRRMAMLRRRKNSENVRQEGRIMNKLYNCRFRPLCTSCLARQYSTISRASSFMQ
eukprot:240625-Pleurochrysis_carterae.AAC.2